MNKTFLIALVAALTAFVACATTSSPRPGEPAPVGTAGTASQPQSVPSTAARNEIPVGQELDVRLQSELSSATANVEDRFNATTVADLMQNGRELIPAGSLVRGVVRSVDRASRIDRKGSLALSFDQVTVQGRNYPIRAMAEQVFSSEGIQGEAPRIGAGAGVGGIVGGILGGVKGALAGILIGAGGTIAATEGKDVTLPAGTIVRIRFDSPLQIRPSTN
jgi:hypothetical protein